MDGTTVAAAEAKTNFFELLERAERGESFVITREGRNAAKLSPIEQRPTLREVNALFDRIERVRKNTLLNPPSAPKITIRELIEEGRK